MELFGKVTKITLCREGVAKMSGNHYEIQNVIVENNGESVVFECYGTQEHLKNHGIVEGAEGKFNLKSSVREYQGKYYMTISLMNISTDFKPLASAEKTETQQQVETIAAAAQAAKSQTEKPAVPQPTKNEPLPF